MMSLWLVALYCALFKNQLVVMWQQQNLLGPYEMTGLTDER